MKNPQGTDVSELPSDDVLPDDVRAAVKLNEDGPPPRARTKNARPVQVPAPLMAALRRNRKALANFETLSPSCRREYAEWVADAKREETRERRIATAVAWIAQGKGRPR